MKNILKYISLVLILIPFGAGGRRIHNPYHRQIPYTNTVDSAYNSITNRINRLNRFCKIGNEGIRIQVSKEGDTSWSLVSGALGFGLNGAVDQGHGTGLQMGKSFEVNWLKAVAAEYQWKQNAITFGLGFDWQNFKMTGDPFRMYKLYGGGLGLAPYPWDTHALNSTLKIFSLQLPVLYSYRFTSIDTKISVGPILHFNTYSSLKTNYINEIGNRTMEFQKNLGQKPVTFDLFCSASWRGLGLYLKYSPLHEMRSRSMVNFNPLTVGFILFM